ncbi:MAG: YybH family protein [Myxococcota bacterium]
MKRALLATLFCVAATAAWAGDDPTAIARSVGEKFGAACGAGNVDAVLALYRKDARVVYPGEGESATDPAALRRMVADTCKPGGAKLELVGYKAVWIDKAHTAIASLGDWRLNATGPDGKPVATPVRATEVLVKTKGGWMYAVDHASIGVAPPPPAPGTSR